MIPICYFACKNFQLGSCNNNSLTQGDSDFLVNPMYVNGYPCIILDSAALFIYISYTGI